MKFFKKVNRGALLTLLVFLGVVIYLISVEVSHSIEKPKIQEICEKYIQADVSYNMLPEKYRVESPEMPKSEFNDYIKKMEADVRAFYPENSLSVDFYVDSLKESLNKQAEGNGVVLEYKKEIKRYNDFTFNGDSVIVEVTTTATYKSTDIDVMKGQNIYNDEYTESFTLQKINGEWELVYANISSPADYNNMYPMKY